MIDAELRRIGLLSLPLKIKRIVRAELMGKFDRAAINLMMRITNERYDLTQELTTKLRTQFEQKLSNISENESEIKSLVEEIVEFCNNEMQMLEKTELYYLRRMIVVHALGSVSWREKSLRILNEVQNRFREDKKAE